MATVAITMVTQKQRDKTQGATCYVYPGRQVSQASKTTKDYGGREAGDEKWEPES